MEKLFFSVALVLVFFSCEASAASVCDNPESYVGQVINFNSLVAIISKKLLHFTVEPQFFLYEKRDRFF
jgi:hypothetical protein